MGAAKTGFLIPKDVWRSPGTEIKQEAAKQDVQHNMSLLKAWTPYLLVTLWLVATRVPQLGIKPFMSSLPISVSNIMGVEGANFTLTTSMLHLLLVLLALSCSASTLYPISCLHHCSLPPQIL